MVYTKHFVIHTIKNLQQANDYVENASKTLVKNPHDLPEHLDNLFPYVINDDKTMSRQLVSGYGVIDIDHASEEFMDTKEKYARQKGQYYVFDKEKEKLVFDRKLIEKGNGKGQAVLAHHLIQSFSPDDALTPEKIHEIGRETVLELTGGEYEFVIATHVDKAHIHNHIIFNATNIHTGKAFRWQKGTKLVYEQISDKIASREGAKIIEKSPKNSHKKYTMWQVENLYKQKIKSRLDYLMTYSHSLDDFLAKAKALNLSVVFSGKWATYQLLDAPQVKNTRARSLDKKILKNTKWKLSKNVYQKMKRTIL